MTSGRQRQSGCVVAAACRDKAAAPCITSFVVCVALQLFGESVPSVPLSSSAPQLQQPAIQPHQQPLQQHTVVLSAAPPAALEGGYWQENTLDESVWQTLKRDVLTIGRNLRSVLIPVNWDFHNHTAALQNWDLWGPLVSARDHQSRSCSAGSHAAAQHKNNNASGLLDANKWPLPAYHRRSSC